MVELPLSMHVHWKHIIRIRFAKKEQSFDRFVLFDFFRDTMKLVYRTVIEVEI